MNAFKRYLKDRSETLTAFAARTGIPISTVHRAAEGKHVPAPETLRTIAEATGGAITPNDFILIDAPADPAPAAEPEQAA